MKLKNYVNEDIKNAFGKKAFLHVKRKLKSEGNIEIKQGDLYIELANLIELKKENNTTVKVFI